MAEFKVGDRVRVLHCEMCPEYWDGRRGSVVPTQSETFDCTVNIDSHWSDGTAFYSRELEPLTQVWKAVRPDLGSAFAGRSTGQAKDYATVTYSASEEAALATAFASLDTAKDFAAQHTVGGYSCGGTLHIYRAEGVVDGQPPDDVSWFAVPPENNLSVRHLLLIERVAVYRDGKEVKDEAESPQPVSLDLDMMQNDLHDLLNALGMFAGARDQSPHECMRECIDKVRSLPEPAAELAAVRQSADEFQELAERLEKWRKQAWERSASLCALLGVVCDDQEPRTTMRRITTAIAELMQKVDRLRDEAIGRREQVASLTKARGEAAAVEGELRGRLKAAEDLCDGFRASTHKSLAKQGELHERLARSAEALKRLEEARADDAPVVEAAVAHQRWLDNADRAGNWAELIRELQAAAKAHPSYQPAEQEPATPRLCPGCGWPINETDWPHVLCGKCQARYDRLAPFGKGTTE